MQGTNQMKICDLEKIMQAVLDKGGDKGWKEYTKLEYHYAMIEGDPTYTNKIVVIVRFTNPNHDNCRIFNDTDQPDQVIQWLQECHGEYIYYNCDCG